MKPSQTADEGILSITEQGNLRCLETAIRAQWRLGQNILLSWSTSSKGVLLLVAPHYFLGHFTASLNDCAPPDRLEALNGNFIRKLISGDRYMEEEEFYSTARRFELNPTFVELPMPLSEDSLVWSRVEELVKRHSISYVAARAVLLFDIVDFSLFTPFEQTSQLNSLSYSLNSAYNKMLQANVEFELSRTTTGDGFYIWNNDNTPSANIQLFHYMQLVVADNAIAKRKSEGNTVPVVRTGFHIGSHYEFHQAQGLNPTMHSYIVGDVTLDLARMLESAQPGQIFIGDFRTQVPTSTREGAYMLEVNSNQFVDRARKLNDLRGIDIAGEKTLGMRSYLTGDAGSSGGESIRRFRIIDKHGLSRTAYNLRINIYRQGFDPIILGLQDRYLPRTLPNRRRGFLNNDISSTAIKPRVRRRMRVTED